MTTHDIAPTWRAVPPLDAGDRELYQWYDELAAEHWDFRRGVERDQARRADPTPRQEDAALGLVAARPPSGQNYDHVLILGELDLAAALVVTADNEMDAGDAAVSPVADGQR